MIGALLDRLGETCYSQNKMQEARTYLERALEMIKRIGTSLFDTARNLFNLFLLLLETGEKTDAKQHLDRLKEIAELEKNPAITNRTVLADALYQMQSPKLLDKAQAQQKLRDLIHQEDLEINLLIIASLHLFNLYLLEWKVSEDEATLEEIYRLLDQLQEIVDIQKILPLGVELQLLRALLALVQGDLSRAEAQITEAIHAAQTHQLARLVTKAQQLHAQVHSQVKEWKTLLDENVSIARRLEKTRMEEYLKAAMRVIYSQG
ncbi:MAG: tetratricopeptide repeat protein [Promethearchaeota archaeon]